MDINVNNLVSKIPDFDEFIKVTNEIGELLFKKLKLEKDIRAREAWVVKEVTTNPQYRLENKVPAMSYIESTYKYSGINNELLDMREQLADLTAMLEKRKLLLSVYKDMLEIFRTVSANQRTSQI